MKKAFLYLLVVSFFVLTIGLPQASAKIADGTQQLNYQVNQPDSTNASIANDYFQKPALVTVTNGSAVVQITLKNSSWITKFEPAGGAEVVNEDLKADTRVVEFSVSDISKPVKIPMKVDVEHINYHHEYTVDLVFEDKSAVTPPAVKSPAPTTPPSTNTNTSTSTVTKKPTSQVPVKNPQTSDTTPYLVIFVLAGSAFLLYKTTFRRKQGEQ
ncbi:heme uptake protein IsdC [Sporosarcina sp. P3]|uniref:heme uptake protein IsdC n=1 Tax=Sporosarcina sp. P3 TaxID=2048245 RepID=UPI000C1711E9|nr:heme uptake protein IsdC [Sporosarcina sp. P3]PID22396.1 heme uptake protein IsdC [Sporosarcina sp. P3]